MSCQGHALVLEHLRRPEGWVQEELEEGSELLLAQILHNLDQTPEKVLLHEVIVLEVVDVAEVTQALEAGDRELMHVLEGTRFPEHEDCSITHLPGFFRSAEAVVHAATAALELRRE